MIEANGIKIPTDVVTVTWADDRSLAATNYFETDYCQLGLCYLCQSCGHWELLIAETPNASELVEAAAGARAVIITRGLLNGKDSFQIRFVDDEEYPYMLTISTSNVGFPPERSQELVRGGIFRIHQHKAGNIPVVLENVMYNDVDTLPWVPRVD